MAKYILVLLLGVIFVWGQPNVKTITIDRLQYMNDGSELEFNKIIVDSKNKYNYKTITILGDKQLIIKKPSNDQKNETFEIKNVTLSENSVLVLDGSCKYKLTNFTNKDYQGTILIDNRACFRNKGLILNNVQLGRLDAIGSNVIAGLEISNSKIKQLGSYDLDISGASIKENCVIGYTRIRKGIKFEMKGKILDTGVDNNVQLAIKWDIWDQEALLNNNNSLAQNKKLFFRYVLQKAEDTNFTADKFSDLIKKLESEKKLLALFKRLNAIKDKKEKEKEKEKLTIILQIKISEKANLYQEKYPSLVKIIKEQLVSTLADLVIKEAESKPSVIYTFLDSNVIKKITSPIVTNALKTNIDIQQKIKLLEMLKKYNKNIFAQINNGDKSRLTQLDQLYVELINHLGVLNDNENKNNYRIIFDTLQKLEKNFEKQLFEKQLFEKKLKCVNFFNVDYDIFNNKEKCKIYYWKFLALQDPGQKINAANKIIEIGEKQKETTEAYIYLIKYYYQKNDYQKDNYQKIKTLVENAIFREYCCHQINDNDKTQIAYSLDYLWITNNKDTKKYRDVRTTTSLRILKNIENKFENLPLKEKSLYFTIKANLLIESRSHKDLYKFFNKQQGFLERTKSNEIYEYITGSKTANVVESYINFINYKDFREFAGILNSITIKDDDIIYNKNGKDIKDIISSLYGSNSFKAKTNSFLSAFYDMNNRDIKSIALQKENYKDFQNFHYLIMRFKIIEECLISQPFLKKLSDLLLLKEIKNNLFTSTNITSIQDRIDTLNGKTKTNGKDSKTKPK